ncbi:MAG: DUF885 domain-containing protein [Gemmatimonadota bacterium]
MRRTSPFLAVCAAALGMIACSPTEEAPTADEVQVQRDALGALLEEQWEYTMRTSPEWASMLGDKRYNDQISDFSEEAIETRLAESREFLERFEAIDTSGFTVQEALNRDLMVHRLQRGIEGARFKPWRMPVNQMSGVHLMAPQMVSMLSYTEVKDYDDLIARYRKLPTAFDQTIDHMRKGMDEGLIPPKFLLEKVAQQAAGLAGMPAEASPFAGPLASFPEGIPPEEQERIREEMLAAIRDDILPAYAGFTEFVRDEYAPAGREEPGMWSLPEGEERYAFLVKVQTTSDLTPEEIHQIGLAEVEALEEEMRRVASSLGYDDLESFNAALEGMPELRPQSREEILEIYRGHIDGMYEKLPELFGRLPQAKVEVLPVEEFREREAAGAQYMRPAPDGSRPGRVMVNTNDPTARKTIDMESTADHEGVPGHHLQLTIAQELPELPRFRQQGGYTSFSEGWALYSERLGKEVGFYSNPYSDYGRLQDEMLRAIRLVVDTGFHFKGWSREDVVQFFRDHSAIDEITIQSETDRYIVWPGQALAYKIGQLKILELRERAETELGEGFDVRAFHDEILGAGALPLDVLEARIDAWIELRKAA